MFPNSLPDPVVHGLYREAEALERRWANCELDDDFAGRMIDATLRCLATRPEAERLCPRRAVRILRYIWSRNAKRDAARRAVALAVGTRPMRISLSALGDDVPDRRRGCFDGRCSLDGGETGLAVVQWLQEQGWPRERAWAFVWYEVRQDWGEVAYLLRTRLGFAATEAQLRQWGVRHFERIKPRLRSALAERI